MKRRIWLAVIASGILLSGCADMQSTIDQVNTSMSDLGKSLSTAGSGPIIGSAGSSGTPITQTKLAGALARSPSTDGRAPEWPKIVIVNLTIPVKQINEPAGYQFKANDCITFDAIMWTDASHNEKFKNLSLCAPEMPDSGNTFMSSWQSFSISGKTSGQVRGDGPTPPYMKLPSDQLMSNWIGMNRWGIYFVGSLLKIVGYDPQFTKDDRRFWVKNTVRGN
ncbi:MAG: hypothetical protein FWF20_04860 [Betaproteobacteria bacterium]|nr:hypothetical protein [Betaproteobacteria bacterium]MCL2886109.1 hypothetical protein [Betaproteobacteria bacterium]